MEVIFSVFSTPILLKNDNRKFQSETPRWPLKINCNETTISFQHILTIKPVKLLSEPNNISIFVASQIQ